MENLQNLLTELLDQQQLLQGILSNLRSKDPESYNKVQVKQMELKGELYLQFSYFYEKKVLHENIPLGEAVEKLMQLFTEKFKQGMLHTEEADFQILISKKHKVTILKKNPTKKKDQFDLSHNRKKNYLLEEGVPVPFLVELGVMTAEGKVVAKKYDKFRQINRFLEMVQDIVPYLSREKTVQIIDFGCGKSYLTFALYHYLRELQGLSIRVVGLDLKADVIRHCNALVEKFGYDQLSFQVGDIAQYEEDAQQVDMVVTLHACDTATDAALEKAIRWGAEVILSVPCCQHELFSQIENEDLEPLLKHGILKERFSALATDAARAQLLEIMGYKTQLLEFIDMEHTPKNLLIRAVKGGEVGSVEEMQKYQQFKQALGIDPYLERALEDQLNNFFRQGMPQALKN